MTRIAAPAWPRSVVAALLAASVAAGALVACTAVTDLKVGDCYDGGSQAEVSTVTSKACTEPHDAEVFATFTHPDAQGAYPGEVTLEFYADRECVNAFDAYVGLAYDDSEFGISYLTPTDEGWRRGDHIVTCVLTAGTDGEKLTGSMKDSRR